MKLVVHHMATDVLVVGGGAASCLAATEAAKFARVTLMDAGKLGRSGSNPSSGGQGVAASFGHFDISTRRVTPGDSPELHLADTIREGAGLSDTRIATAVCAEICDRIRETEKSGTRYGRTPDGDHYLQRGGFGHSHPRICLCGSGWDFMAGLAKEVHFRDVAVRNFHMVTGLLLNDGVCAGVVAVDRMTGDVWVVQAGAVILTSGSATGLQKYHTACYLTNGDTFRLALSAGAELADMEFTEFSLVPAPRGTLVPTSGISPYIGRGAVFYNALGERFMARYNPAKLERGTRSGLVQAVFREMLDGRGPCYLDATGYSDQTWADFIRDEPDVLRKLHGLADPRTERVEWVPALHSFLGGVHTNEWGETRIPGLFAAGEAAAGMHGANRLGGNAVASCLVMGARAARRAVRFVRSRDGCDLPAAAVSAEVDRLQALWSESGDRPHLVETDIRKLAWESVGIIRDGAGLQRGVTGFAELQERRVRTRNREEWLRAIELVNLAFTGEVVARSALVRAESRGQHRRSEFPDMRREWECRVVMGQGKQVRTVAVTGEASGG